MFTTEIVLRRSRRGGGGTWGPDPQPLENYKAKELFDNTGPDPLKNHKATKPAFTFQPL